MATREEMMLNDLKNEIEALKQSQIYQGYIKFNKEYAEGKNVELIIQRKMKRFNQIVAELQAKQQEPEPETADEYPEYQDENQQEQDTEEEPPLPPTPSRPQKLSQQQQQAFKSQLKQNRPTVTPQREKEINQKIKESAQNTFEAEASELGLDDDIPGLPDDLEN